MTMTKAELLRKLEEDQIRDAGERAEREWKRSPDRLLELAEELNLHGPSPSWRQRWNEALAATADEEPLPLPKPKPKPKPEVALALPRQATAELAAQMNKLGDEIEKLRRVVKHEHDRLPGIVTREIT